MINSTVRGYDLFFVVDVGNYSCTYNYFGQDSIFIIEKEIEVEMKAELYSFLLENKFKNGVMYIKSMHEFVVKYDMAESVEEESLMRGFQRWRKKMKEE